MKCSICKAPYHPSTGHRFTSTAVLCGGCAKDFLAWYKARMGAMGAPRRIRLTGKKDLESFADAAAKSIK